MTFKFMRYACDPQYLPGATAYQRIPLSDDEAAALLASYREHFPHVFEMWTKSKEKHTMNKQPKPFNLAAALAGDKVLLRDGRTARVVHHNPNAYHSGYTIVGFDSDEKLLAWSIDGGYCHGSEEYGEDIIGMAPKTETRTLWFNVYTDPMNGHQLYGSREAATSHVSSPEQLIETRSITFEVTL